MDESYSRSLIQRQGQIALNKNIQLLPTPMELGSVPNGDKETVPHYLGVFSKSLTHDKDGKVDKKAFDNLIQCLQERNPEKLELVSPNKIKLLNVSACFSWEIYGREMSTYYVQPSPIFRGEIMASHADELYGCVRLRDVPFSLWNDSHPIVADVCKNLSRWPIFSASLSSTFPRNAKGQVVAETLFRGPLATDCQGFFISQFLLQDYKHGIIDKSQFYPRLKPGINYMFQESTYLPLLNGQENHDHQKGQQMGPRKFICTPRDLVSVLTTVEQVVEMAHVTAMILESHGIPKQKSDMKSFQVETHHVTLGSFDLFELCYRVSKLALDACWYAKWVNLSPRPEHFGWYLQQTFKGNKLYEMTLSEKIYTSSNVRWCIKTFGSALLPQCFPNGSPACPSYPCSFTAVMSACVVLLKAWYDCTSSLPLMVIPFHDGSKLIELKGAHDNVSVQTELDKLVSNVGFARQAAGVNFRADCIKGARLGEKVAISFLELIVKRYKQPVNWVITKRNGQVVTFSNCVGK